MQLRMIVRLSADYRLPAVVVETVVKSARQAVLAERGIDDWDEVEIRARTRLEQWPRET